MSDDDKNLSENQLLTKKVKFNYWGKEKEQQFLK